VQLSSSMLKSDPRKPLLMSNHVGFGGATSSKITKPETRKKSRKTESSTATASTNVDIDNLDNRRTGGGIWWGRGGQRRGFQGDKGPKEDGS